MSVATVAVNKPSKRPQYKDYVSFLETYKNGRKEDQSSIATTDSGVSFSLSNSSNNSSSSVYSDLGETPKNSFKEYLDNYNSKRYSSVQAPCHVKKQQAEAKTVKTEVFLEINSPPATVTKVVDVSDYQEAPKVNKVSKIFETNATHTLTKSIPPSGKVNTFNFEHRDAASRKTSVGGNHQKVQLKKSLSISEKSRVFEDSNKESKSQKEEPVKVNGCISPKPLINRKPVFAPKPQTEDNATSRTNGTTSPKPFANVQPAVVPPEKHITVVEKIHLERTSPVLSTPPPPPLPPVFQQTQTTYVPPACPPPPPPFQNGTGAPAPPPPPPMNFSVKKIQNPPKSNVPNVQKAAINGGPKSNDIVDGTTVPVINKNDPRVKKMVYGALRDMYGAYHDKANDYIATLPRNRVKKNNGLDSIINSIASQGGLEKLNGRVNPSVETD